MEKAGKSLGEDIAAKTIKIRGRVGLEKRTWKGI